MVVIICGTRPECIKLGPVYKALVKRGVDIKVLHTGQHPVSMDVHITGLPEPHHRITSLPKGIEPFAQLASLQLPIKRHLQRWRARLALVQGDTTSALAGAKSAHELNIPVGHVEAGLRTYNNLHPWPEEIFRRDITRLATYHFAPTALAVSNLEQEGATNVMRTGNPIVDAVHQLNPPVSYGNEVIVTLHRRENFLQMADWFSAIADLAKNNSSFHFVCPLHPNPLVQAQRKHLEHVDIIKPLSYQDFLFRLAASRCIITDSGGLQEEAVCLGKSALICREITERPEALSMDIARLVTPESLPLHFKWAIHHKPAALRNPFGDGAAGERIADAVVKCLAG